MPKYSLSQSKSVHFCHRRDKPCQVIEDNKIV